MLRPSPNHGTQRLPNDDDDCWSVMARLKMFAIGLAITLDPYFSSSPGNSSLPLARLLLSRFMACCTSDSVIGSFRGRGSPVNVEIPCFTSPWNCSVKTSDTCLPYSSWS